MNLRAAGLLAAVLLALGGIVAAFGLGGDRAGEGLADGTTTTTEARPAAEVIQDVKGFVSAQRGLPFLRDVPVELLDDEQFEARLLEDAEEDRADAEDDERVLRALGLLEPGVDLYDVLLGFIGDAVVGFYDPEAGELVVRGGRFSPYARATLAHELTHALDDQHFDLDRPEIEDGEDEAGLAFQALAEGSALRVEQAYRDEMSAPERLQAALEEEQLAVTIDLSEVPPVIPGIIGFPYLAGPSFVDALAELGGERRIDQAFREPPTTSEDILDPEGWLEGREVLEVPDPAAEGEIIDEGVYGESTLVLTLEPVLGTEDATKAADGWGGDRYVAWRTPQGGACVRATFAMDTPADLAELTRSLREWAAERGARIARGDGTITFTSCG